MRNPALYALNVAVSALLAGCGVLRQAQDDMQPPIGVPGAMPQAPAVMPGRTLAHRVTSLPYTVAHEFNSKPSGAGRDPRGGLLDLNGTLYGTTFYGGAYGYGTVFSITTTGEENVLYSFSGGSDGGYPVASLINVNGTLYGTTQSGGDSSCFYGISCGTVYSIGTTGEEKVLHAFSGGSDGRFPDSGLIDVKGTLYGTTYYGGSSLCRNGWGCGTVFSINIAGEEKVVYSFRRGVYGDGQYPRAGLLDVKHTLYGTTEEGGGYACGKHVNCGAVYSVTMTGKERVLHSFNSTTDGALPTAGLIDVQGTLYGTTYEGGNRAFPKGCGTIYGITTAGSEQVFHVFTCSDGRHAVAGLTNVHGELYGTTSQGGTRCERGGGSGCGVIFALTP